MNTARYPLAFLFSLIAACAICGCSEDPPQAEAAVGKKLDDTEAWKKQKSTAEVFAEGDVDGDGRLSSDELPSRFLLKWDLIDGNADGYIDAAEQAAYLNPRGSEVVAVEPEKEEAPEREAGRGAGQIGDLFAEADANGDGRISLQEAPERMQGRFDILDGNGDGFVDAAEQAAMVKRMKEKSANRRRPGGGRGGSRGGGFGGGGFRGLDFGPSGGGGGGGGKGGRGGGGQQRTIVPPRGN